MARWNHKGSEKAKRQDKLLLPDQPRTRRAFLVAEFERELGVDHAARARAAAHERRWQRISASLLWAMAIILFGAACYILWLMGQNVDRPFMNIHPFITRIGWTL